MRCQPLAQSHGNATHRRPEAGAEHCVQEQVCTFQQLGCPRCSKSGFIRSLHRHQVCSAQPVQRRARISLKVRGAAQQQHADIAPGLGQDARSDESVTAIVSFSTERHNALVAALGVRKLLQHEARHSRAGILHQRHGRYAVFRRGGRIGGAHFCRGQDLHAGVGCTSLRMRK